MIAIAVGRALAINHAMENSDRRLPAYRDSLAGTLLAAREAVMKPIRPILRDAAVTEQQWRVLRVLKDNGPMEPTMLADAALLYAPSVARILKELMERGMVVRAPHPHDRRRAVMSLAPAGEALMQHTSAQTIAKLDEYTMQFGEERLSRLIGELKSLIETVGTDAEGDAQSS